MPPITTSSFAQHLAPGIREIVGTNLEGRESFYSMYHNVETTKRNYEDFLWSTGLPIAVEKPQGTNIQSFDPIEGLTKRLTPKVYAIGMEVTEEGTRFIPCTSARKLAGFLALGFIAGFLIGRR